jgi:hypothetical protein
MASVARTFDFLRDIQQLSATTLQVGTISTVGCGGQFNGGGPKPSTQINKAKTVGSVSLFSLPHDFPSRSSKALRDFRFR